jgi:hypothetical protein
MFILGEELTRDFFRPLVLAAGKYLNDHRGQLRRVALEEGDPRIRAADITG